MEKGIHSGIDTYIPAIYTSNITGANLKVRVKKEENKTIAKYYGEYISDIGNRYYRHELTFTK